MLSKDVEELIQFVSQSKKKPFVFHELESVNRITNLPIVESGWNYAGNIYSKIKGSNSLFYWTLDQAETSFQVAVEVATPAIVLFKGPISSIDKLVCKSLDIVEHNVPSINLPPEMIYWNTKKYVTDVSTKIARPVLKRADSVKQIGNTVLASKYTVFAAKSLDEALDVADKYVDKYLPGYDDQTVDEVDTPIDGPTGKAIHTIHHADRFSRKLTRRLTQRTIAEVKALKHHSAEAVHVLTYVAELIATDPVLAYQKGKELWASLSKNEPENQARPENLEQLIVLLMRESARRVVHLINYSSTVVSKVPRNVSYSVTNMVRKILNVADSMVKEQLADNLTTPGNAKVRIISATNQHPAVTGNAEEREEKLEWRREQLLIIIYRYYLGAPIIFFNAIPTSCNTVHIFND
uniref:Lipid storage droplets surface-binding protein 1 n=1 Tax=Anoplophora glabripennis TaxID=217634 RepID=V5G204_ANOGL